MRLPWYSDKLSVMNIVVNIILYNILITFDSAGTEFMIYDVMVGDGDIVWQCIHDLTDEPIEII